MNTYDPTFPVTLDIDYPDRPLDRLTTFFRPLVIIPIGLVLALVSGPGSRFDSSSVAWACGGIIFLPTLLMLLFRQKYPRWWFDWNVELVRFAARCGAYAALLRDEYPSTDEEQSVHIAIPYPDVTKDLGAGMPLVKWFLAIPHYVIVTFLAIVAVCCVLIAWCSIVFTGRYPRPLFDFVVGVFRWWLRVFAYAFLLTTDQYPPFRLEV